MNAARSQRGFTLLETLIAGALSTAFMIAMTGAVLATMRAGNLAANRADLTDHALNILSDLRETTAYDTGGLARVEGRTATTSFPANASANAPMLTATISVSDTTPVVAVVTVRDNASGTSVTESQTLYTEAPAPGSVVNQPSPSPAQQNAGDIGR